MEFLLFLIVGAFAGFAAGLLGIGGGLITVPALVLILPVLNFNSAEVMHIAIATSLAAIVPTSMLSAYRHNSHGAIDWKYAQLFLPGLIVGSIAGVYLVTYITREPLQLIFAGFLFFVSVYLLLGQPLPRQITPAGQLLNRIVSAVIGLISALLGVGGGTMTVPYLVWRGVDPRIAVGTSAFCGIPIAVAAVLTFYWTSDANQVASSGGYIYWPAFFAIVLASIVVTPLGVNLAHKIATIKLKRIFAVLLLLVAFDLLLDTV